MGHILSAESRQFWIAVARAEGLDVGGFVMTETWAELLHDLGAMKRSWKFVKGSDESYISPTDGHQIHGIYLLLADSLQCPISYPQTSRNSVFLDKFRSGPALSLFLCRESDDHLCSVADYLHEFAEGLVCVSLTAVSPTAPHACSYMESS